MSKKIVALCLVLLMLFCLMTSCQTVEKEDGYTYRLNKDKESYTLVEVEKCGTNVTIDKFHGLPVTVIGDEAFEKRDNIQSVVIGDSVVEIGEEAFGYSPELSHLEIGKNVQIIGKSAFYDCDALSSVNIPDSVVQIRDYAFAICNQSLKSVRLGKNVTSIGEFAFESCLSLRSINLPQNVQTIGNSAFADCRELTYVFFEGTPADWAKIEVSEGNTPLLSHLYYYSHTQPNAAGNYWHYNAEGNPVAW